MQAKPVELKLAQTLIAPLPYTGLVNSKTLVRGITSTLSFNLINSGTVVFPGGTMTISFREQGSSPSPGGIPWSYPPQTLSAVNVGESAKLKSFTMTGTLEGLCTMDVNIQNPNLVNLNWTFYLFTASKELLDIRIALMGLKGNL